MIQSQLDSDETVIDYLLSNRYNNATRKLFTFIITRNSLECRETNLDSTFAINADNIRTGSKPGRNKDFKSYTGALNYMYESLIKPSEDLFKGQKLIIIPDEEIHQHYTELLGRGDAILYGRTTYQLMEFWRTLLENPSDEKSINDFAVAIDKIPKIVFSRTIKNVEWESATIAKRDLKDEVLALRQQPGKDIFVGSRSLILQLLKLGLIDEFQLCIHPLVEGKGLPLFEKR